MPKKYQGPIFLYFTYTWALLQMSRPRKKKLHSYMQKSRHLEITWKVY